MKFILKLLLTLFLSLPLIIYAKPYPIFPNYDEVAPLYLKAFDKDYFKKGLKNPDLTDVECLAYVLYGEARGEPQEGIIAVAYVVKNRMKKYNMSYCQVVGAPNEFLFKIKKLYNVADDDMWYHCLNIAYYLIIKDGYDTFKSPVDGAIYFNSLSFLEQSVMGKNRFVGRIGHHYFYK